MMTQKIIEKIMITIITMHQSGMSFVVMGGFTKTKEEVMFSAQSDRTPSAKSRCIAHAGLFLSVVAAIFLTLLVPPSWATNGDDNGNGDNATELTLETVQFFIEFNETDEDIGVQARLGGEPYVSLSAFDPSGRNILDVKPRTILKEQGLGELFFESAEPPLDEFSINEFLDRFPEGKYEFKTVTVDGLNQNGEALFTHVIPAGPEIISPTEGEVVDPNQVLVTWSPVTMTTAFAPPQRPVNIIGYQVIVTREDPLRVISIDVPPDTTSVSIPPEFLEPGTEYELEVLAIEESNNQTISLLFFETE